MLVLIIIILVLQYRYTSLYFECVQSLFKDAIFILISKIQYSYSSILYSYIQALLHVGHSIDCSKYAVSRGHSMRLLSFDRLGTCSESAGEHYVRADLVSSHS